MSVTGPAPSEGSRGWQAPLPESGAPGQEAAWPRPSQASVCVPACACVSLFIGHRSYQFSSDYLWKHLTRSPEGPEPSVISQGAPRSAQIHRTKSGAASSGPGCPGTQGRGRMGNVGSRHLKASPDGPAPAQRHPKASMAAWGACEADRGGWLGQSQGPGQWRLGETWRGGERHRLPHTGPLPTGP